MPNQNIPNHGLGVDPSERTIDGAQNLEAEGVSADAAEEDGAAGDESEASGGINAE
jgi:hypothetical protein